MINYIRDALSNNLTMNLILTNTTNENIDDFNTGDLETE